MLQEVADGEAVGAAMDRFIDVIVRRSIRHARMLQKQGAHDWPIARRALRKILADLESRSPNDPSLRRLRTFIASNDCAWLRGNKETR